MHKDNNQEEIILLVTIQTMLESWQPRSDIVRLIDEFLYPHLRKENEKTIKR